MMNIIYGKFANTSLEITLKSINRRVKALTMSTLMHINGIRAKYCDMTQTMTSRRALYEGAARTPISKRRDNELGTERVNNIRLSLDEIILEQDKLEPKLNETNKDINLNTKTDSIQDDVEAKYDVRKANDIITRKHEDTYQTHEMQLDAWNNMNAGDVRSVLVD